MGQDTVHGPTCAQGEADTSAPLAGSARAGDLSGVSVLGACRMQQIRTPWTDIPHIRNAVEKVRKAIFLRAQPRGLPILLFAKRAGGQIRSNVWVFLAHSLSLGTALFVSAVFQDWPLPALKALRAKGVAQRATPLEEWANSKWQLAHLDQKWANCQQKAVALCPTLVSLSWPAFLSFTLPTSFVLQAACICNICIFTCRMGPVQVC